MGKTRAQLRTISDQLRWHLKQSGETGYSLEQNGISNNVTISRFARGIQNLQGSTIDALADHMVNWGGSFGCDGETVGGAIFCPIQPHQFRVDRPKQNGGISPIPLIPKQA